MKVDFALRSLIPHSAAYQIVRDDRWRDRYNECERRSMDCDSRAADRDEVGSGQVQRGNQREFRELHEGSSPSPADSSGDFAHCRSRSFPRFGFSGSPCSIWACRKSCLVGHMFERQSLSSTVAERRLQIACPIGIQCGPHHDLMTPLTLHRVCWWVSQGTISHAHWSPPSRQQTG